ncbi:hypothetical protein RYX36_034029 [Vicia faba]
MARGAKALHENTIKKATQDVGRNNARGTKEINNCLGRRSTNKSYSRDNRLIFPKSSHRREGLAPRCRLFATWSCSRFQGLGCSPIKAVRELGSERRETIRSISGVGVRALRGPFPSTRGLGRTHLWCASYRANDKRWSLRIGAENPPTPEGGFCPYGDRAKALRGWSKRSLYNRGSRRDEPFFVNHRCQVEVQ